MYLLFLALRWPVLIWFVKWQSIRNTTQRHEYEHSVTRESKCLKTNIKLRMDSVNMHCAEHALCCTSMLSAHDILRERYRTFPWSVQIFPRRIGLMETLSAVFDSMVIA